MTGIEQWLLPKLGFKAPPWTLHRRTPDHKTLKPAAECTKIAYPKPDGKLTFDRLSSVFVSNTNHAENQPAHLTLKDPSGAGAHQPGHLRRARRAATARPRVYEFVPNDHRRRAAADQRPELRALQDLRHQGPDAEHRLGHARRRRRAELRRHVMGAAPLALVRGAIEPRTASAWLEAIDAHPAWQRRGAEDAAFNVQSSSLRLAAVPGLDAVAIADLLLRGDVGTFCRSRLGAALSCDVDQCWIRRQYAPSRYPPGHAPHAWHQDGALAFDFLDARQRRDARPCSRWSPAGSR